MTISIPSGIFEDYYFPAVDMLLENPYIGREVTVVYETKTQQDYNVFGEEVFDPETSVETDTLKLRMYPNPKNWIKSGSNIEFITGRVQVLGYMSDSDKLCRASYIQLDSVKYKLAVEPVRHGFGSRYFLAFLDLI